MSTKKKSKQPAHLAAKTFADHIGELRLRVMWVALTFIVTSAVAYSFRDPLINFVLAPLGSQKLIYLTPAGGFSFIFQITMYAGAVVTAPLVVFQLYRFVQPALPARVRRYSVRVVVAATLLMLTGVCFGYFVAIPAALHFLTTFASGFVVANLTADSYLSFVIAYVVGLGLIFQLPLLLIFWNWISPLPPGKLLSTQRFVVLFAFVAAALITPTPDVFNQSLVAVPIIIVYQLGVIAVFVMNRRARRKASPAQADPAPVVIEPVVEPKVMTAVSSVAPPKPRPVTSMDMVRGVSHAPPQRVVGHPRAAAPSRPLPRLTRPTVSLDGVSTIFPRETA
jgi:sec-independent protein translocase protein TatC